MPRTADKYARKRIEAALAKNGIEPWQGETVTAYVNHDRWVADCPCNGAELVAPGEEMLCGSCGAKHQVKFPKHRADIEAALAPREPYNRNWHPDETVDELVAQNIDHGILPDDMRL